MSDDEESSGDDAPRLSARFVEGELVDAFVRLARGDFTVRLARTRRRDTEDLIAYFVNLIAEELDRMLSERDRLHASLEADVTRLSESFLALAAGDFDVRAERTGKGDPMDVLAYLFNNTAEEIGEAFGELERRRTLLETTLESMVDGVLLLAPDGVVQRANGAIAQLLGRDREALVGMSLRELVAPRDEKIARALSGVAEHPVRDRDVTFLDSERREITLVANASPVRDHDGTLVGVVLVARDESQLRAARAQLQMADRLATMGTVAAGVAHEINNPLAYVIANLDFVSEELERAREEAPRPLDPETLDELVRALTASRDGAARVRQIVGDLKTFSRADEETSLVDVVKLVESSASMIRNEVRHHARLEKRLDPAPLVRASEGRLIQVFLNLIQNAAQAIPAGHVQRNEICVTTGTTGGGDAFVEVSDTGSGIAPEALPRIFDAFFTTKPVGLGTGIGLSICQTIVAGVGGRILVESALGEGSRFRVVLPAAGSEARPDAAPADPRARPASTRSQTILVVDDEVEVGLSIARLLGPEHEVDVVTRGAAALERLEHTDYDVVLCDVMMPEMTGTELHALLARDRPELAERLVFMTAGAFETDVRRTLDGLSNRVIEKPFDREVLLAILSERSRG